MSIELPVPNESIIARRAEIVRALQALAGTDAVIADEDGRRAYETDALTSYRRMPLAVVLPTTTETVSKVLKYAKANGIKVVARGAGTSLCGGSLPYEDAIVVGVSKMNKVLAIDLENRFIRAQSGITNIAISNAVAGDGFFYAPDPSSQIACTLAGNVAMNSGGAHCLKYGVTTNNVLGVKIVLIDGEIVDIGGSHLDSEGYDLLALIVGSEGQFGIVTEVTVRILRAAEAARPMMIGFESSAKAGMCVARIIASGIIPVAIEFMDRPAIAVCEDFAKAGYPLDVEALLIIEVEGSEEEISDRLAYIASLAEELTPRPSPSALHRSRAPASGRAASRHSAHLGASPITTAWTAPSRLHIYRTCSTASPRSASAMASKLRTSSMPAMATCIPWSCMTPTSRRRLPKPKKQAPRS